MSSKSEFGGPWKHTKNPACVKNNWVKCWARTRYGRNLVVAPDTTLCLSFDKRKPISITAGGMEISAEELWKYWLWIPVTEFSEEEELAMSTFSPVGSRSSNGMRIYVSVCVCMCLCACVRACVSVCVYVCVDRINLKYALCWHIHIYISVHSVLCQCYTQAHTHPQTIWG